MATKRLGWIANLPESGGAARKWTEREDTILAAMRCHEDALRELWACHRALAKEAERAIAVEWSKTEILNAKAGAR